MIIIRRIMRLAAVGIVMALCGSRALAQNYYSLQNTNWPPLPFLPFKVPVHDLGDGFLAYDDPAPAVEKPSVLESEIPGEQQRPKADTALTLVDLATDGQRLIVQLAVPQNTK